MPQTPPLNDLLRETIARLRLFFRLEQKLLGLLLSYALAIGIFSLIIPLTVQELVNTFAYAIQPIMIVTLAGIMMFILLFVAAFRALQLYAVEILEQRTFARIALALSHQLPRFQDLSFRPEDTNRFFEAVLMQRALTALAVDVVNVVVTGMIGMTLMVLYHPYFLAFNVFLVAGFGAVIVLLSQDGLRTTLIMSEAKYQTFQWLQDVANDLLHFKSTVSGRLVLERTDELVKRYVEARRSRFKVLIRLYLGAVGFQAIGHGGLIFTAGWLLAIGQITLGQFVASEVIVGTLLLNFESVVRRIYNVFYFFTSLAELDRLFALPKDAAQDRIGAKLPDLSIHGLRLSCRELAFAYPNSPPVFEHFNLEAVPGEKLAIFPHTSTGKSTLAKVLAGLYTPTAGVVRYNGVDLRDMDLDSINFCRGLVLSSPLSLFAGTLEENITMGRPQVQYEDLQWALRFVEMEEEVDAMPLGLRTSIRSGGKMLPTSQILRILIARAIVTRPELLIFEGTLHNMEPVTREVILRRLCSKEEPWSVIFISNDPTLGSYVERRLLLD